MGFVFELSSWKKVAGLAAFLALVALSGVLVGYMGVRVVLVIIALVVIIFALPINPAMFIAVWVFFAPFLQGKNISLGAGIPDITLDRVMFIWIFSTAVIRLSMGQMRLHKFNMEDYLILLFLLFGLISILFLKNMNTTRQLYFWFDSYFVPIFTYYIILHIFKTEKDMRAFIYAALGALFILTFYTPLEYFTGKNMLGMPSQFIQGTIRVRSFTSAAWVLGAFAGMYLPFTIYAANLQRTIFPKIWRYLAVITVMFGVLGVFFTFMRAAWLSIFALLVLMALGNRKSWKLAAVILFLALIFAALYPAISQTTVWRERVSGQDTVDVRLVLAEIQLNLFKESPITGQGIATLPDTFYIKTVPNGFGGEFDVSLPSHNMYATIMVEFGLFGILYIGAILKILFSGFNAYWIAPRKIFLGKELLIMLLGSSVVFLIQAVTFETRFFTSITLFFWITLALLRVATERIFETVRLAGDRRYAV